MLATNEISLVIRELCRLMEDYHLAPKAVKPAIYEDIQLLGTVIEPSEEKYTVKQ